MPSVDVLVEGIIKGNTSSLGRAITLIESNRKDHLEKANAIVQKCLSQKRDAIRIGITGVPGVGKSNFIANFAPLLIAKGNRLAVLAVDPTSTQSKGSILGD